MGLHVIKSTDRIGQLLKHGRKAYHPTFTLFYVRDASSTDGEFAVIAGKKAFKKAVARNFAKRRMRALLRACGIPAGMSVILMAKPPLTNAKYDNLLAVVGNMVKGL